MKIFDCFMYFDEDLVLDVRLNCLDKFVDYFVIIEASYNHKGEKRDPKFKIENFKNFRHKIIYFLIENQPNDLDIVDDSSTEKLGKEIMNALKRENYQRDQIKLGLDKADDNDWIIISDLDEIPKLEDVNLNSISNRFVFFKQYMIYYKFNLYLDEYPWIGSKACRMKDLKNPQWLRNIKDRQYPKWRIDTYFSNTKYTDIKILEDGGWHFSYVKKPKDIELKLKSYLHHTEYELNPLGEKKIEDLINKHKSVYDLKADTRSNKFNTSNDLKKLELKFLPKYVQENISKYKDWII